MFFCCFNRFFAFFKIVSASLPIKSKTVATVLLAARPNAFWADFVLPRACRSTPLRILSSKRVTPCLPGYRRRAHRRQQVRPQGIGEQWFSRSCGELSSPSQGAHSPPVWGYRQSMIISSAICSGVRPSVSTLTWAASV